MNYQRVVWREIFLERHYSDAAPQQHSLLKQGLESYMRAHARIQSLGRTAWGERVRVPPEFWKMAASEAVGLQTSGCINITTRPALVT
jgi:hypothetical protein